MLLFIRGIIFFFLVGFVYSNSNRAIKSIIKNEEQVRAAVSGGVLAASGDFPYVVFLSLTNGMFVSGGTLIGSSHILTSAQSLLTGSANFMSMLRVTFNSLSTFGGANAFLLPVSKIVIHELFNATTLDNNLALVVLSSPVTNLTFASLPVLVTSTTTKTQTTTQTLTTKTPTTTKIQTTKKIPTTKTPTKKIPSTIKTSTKALTTIKAVTTTKNVPTTIKTTTKFTTTKPTPTTAKATTKLMLSQKPVGKVSLGFNSYANLSAVIAGWGRITPGGKTSPLLLKKVNATIQDNQICTSYYGNNTFFGTNMLCATSPVACLDDTGSPIIIDGVQVGITMWGTMCSGATAYSGIYTRVTTYLDWIENALINNPGPVVG
ncbi:anionic trypsin-2-like [Daphnia pulex]|uniref:anionic trypsin-2-like n=1 Tax=Daphnia pulex TaxID=6669 RepID=UPI001EDD4C16|nr:anionic trypsin-2-like [Daphnia pulex]